MFADDGSSVGNSEKTALPPEYLEWRTKKVENEVKHEQKINEDYSIKR